jgi:predicted GNAT family acetyltransferase
MCRAAGKRQKISANMKDFEVIHKPADGRFEVWKDGSVAYVEYDVHDGALDIMHTIVPFNLEGRGVGSALVEAAYEWGRGEGLVPVATCRFAHVWLQRHPEAK